MEKHIQYFDASDATDANADARWTFMDTDLVDLVAYILPRM